MPPLQAAELVELPISNSGLKDLNTLKQAFTSWAPIAGPTTDGGAGLKALAATWFAQQLVTTQSGTLQNPKVKHG